MADLNAYLNFTAQLDKSVTTPIVRLADTSAYPTGVAAGITSRSFSITQPDNITVTGTSLTPELRLASDGNFQKGLYTFVFTVLHPGYTDANILTRSFTLYYDKPVSVITDSFDEFKPVLTVYDNTVYAQNGFAYPTITKNWTALFGTTTITGTGLSFDLISAGYYYNSAYQVTLQSTVVYIPLSASWLSVKDKATIYSTYKTIVPASLSQLFNDLSNFQALIKDDCCSTDNHTEEKYTYAFSLFQHLIMRGKCGSTIGLRKYIEQIQCILFGAVPVSSNTGEIIPAYSFTDFCGVACGCNESTLVIIDQPDNLTVNEGSNAVFTVGVSGGVVPYGYQWQKDEVDIPGANATAYTVVSATDANEGGYRCKITDASGTVVYSNSATLTVTAISALSISVHPASETIDEGANVTFSVTAMGGITPYGYQWRKSTDGGTTWTNISGAVSISYTKTNLVTGDAGSYDVVVSHAGSGTVTSNAAVLTVNSSVVITYGYIPTDPYVDNITAPAMGTTSSATVGNNAQLFITFPSPAVDKFLVIKIPSSQPTPTIWYSTSLNNGTIPDAAFRAVFTVGAYKYLVSRDAAGVSFDYTVPFQFQH